MVDAGFGIEILSDTELTYWDGTDHIGTATVSFGINEWHHIAVVVNGGTTSTVYFDGLAVGSGTPLNNDALACTGVTIGGGNYFNERWNGAIDQVRFYDGALSDADVVLDMERL